ncbi:MAG TPA: hypothetical protein VD833_03980 [Vicinamibacterales bacterium]|nr:hypothetical protein [Vicinamibacterales bacterium]
MRTAAVVALCTSLASGCATAPAAVRQAGVRTVPDQVTREVLGDLARQLPAGSRVVVTLDSGQRIRGTLLRVTGDQVVLHPRVRVPEPPLEISLDTLRGIEADQPNGGMGKAIAIGAAVGAGAALGILMLLAAIYAD